ncbi:MAG TPA: PAS domain S-box protein, partial [Sphingobacteriaceae bacterium]
VNHAATELYGYSRHEFLALTMDRLRHREDAEAWDQFRQTALKEKILHLEARHLHKNGRIIHVRITSYPVTHNSTRARVSQIVDQTERVKLEEKVHLEHKRFESLIKNSEDIIIVTNRQGIITYVSPACTRITGYTTEDLVGRPVESLLHPEEYQKSLDLGPELTNTPEQTIHRRNRIRRKDGSFAWMEGTVTNLLNDDSINGYVSNYRDISQRVQDEKKIRETEANLKAIFESSVEGFIVTDANLNIKAFNARARDLIFVNTIRTDLEVGTNLLDYIEPQRLTFFKDITTQVLQGEVVEYERGHETINGHKWIRYAVFPVREDAAISGLCITGRDNTVTVEARNQLKNSHRLYKTLVQEGSDLINVIDFEGNYKHLSESLNSVLYNKSDEFIGTNAFELVHPDDRDKLREEFQALHTVKRAKSSPYRFHVGNNQYRWIETVATNLMDDPSIEGIVINSHDITDSINHLQAIERQNSLLQEIAWLQAHKVRAPVASILGIIGLFNNEVGTPEEKELVRMLKQSAVQLDNIIREIIDRTDSLNDGQQ